MNTRLLNHLKYAAIYPLLIAIVFITAVPSAQAEEVFLFRSTDATTTNSVEMSRSLRQEAMLKFDNKGNLLILCGSARITVAYDVPADPVKPSCQYDAQRGPITPVIGISLSLSLTF